LMALYCRISGVEASVVKRASMTLRDRPGGLSYLNRPEGPR
jgi:hypothetical protein